MKFDIKFEIYGKKMKTSINADSKNEAVKILKDKIIIHDISEDYDGDDEDNYKGLYDSDRSVENLMKIFGIKK